jgi:hypothetical protein
VKAVLPLSCPVTPHFSSKRNNETPCKELDEWGEMNVWPLHVTFHKCSVKMVDSG